MSEIAGRIGTPRQGIAASRRRAAHSWADVDQPVRLFGAVSAFFLAAVIGVRSGWWPERRPDRIQSRKRPVRLHASRCRLRAPEHSIASRSGQKVSIGVNRQRMNRQARERRIDGHPCVAIVR